MAKPIYISKIIKKFKKKIKVNGDKSLSIRWALMASQAIGKSRAYNLLKSEDVLSTLNCLKKLGIKITFKNKYCDNAEIQRQQYNIERQSYGFDEIERGYDGT